MYVIGLMGGIASGKTNISKYLLTKGANIIDADIIARKLQEPNKEANHKIREVFGDEFFSQENELLRAALGAYVFGNKEKLAKLNSIMYPLIVEEIKDRLEAYKKEDSKLVIIDAAMLIDAKGYDLCNETWLITADVEERIRRLEKRNSLNRELANARIISQRTDEELKKYADHIITTEGTIEETRKIVDGLLEDICQKNNIVLQK